MPATHTAQGLQPDELASSQRSAVHARYRGSLALAAGLLALALLAVAVLARGVAPAWSPAAAALSVALLVLHTGLLSAYGVSRQRQRPPRRPAAPGPDPPGLASTRIRVLRLVLRRPQAFLLRVPQDLLSGATLLAPVSLALILASSDWSPAAASVIRSAWDDAGVGGALLLAFGLLVLERHLSTSTVIEWPEAPALVPLVRVALMVALAIAANGALVPADSAWRDRVATAVLLAPTAVATEMSVRLLLSLFVRQDARDEPRMIAISLLAQLLRWPPRPIRNFQDELRSRFGIDLRQNWAFGYIQRSLIPVSAAVLGAAWLLSGVREVAADARAIHEQFGRPVAVWGPGLHLGLPWPFSCTRPVDNGVVRTLAIATTDEMNAPTDMSTADGPPPETANRLWDASHVSEKSQVIARRAADRQSFEVVYMDVRFVYRIGLDDEAALAATYQAADLPTLIRSAASRVLVKDFATRTLDGVIGATREAMARDIGDRVQHELDAMRSGVEILTTLIESVHPPAAAANAYHSVQAAQIRTQAAIARERGRAAEESNEARLQATMTLNKAGATARESLAVAESASRRFSADSDAHRGAGSAFLLERYLGQLSQGLAGSKLVLLDHRIGSARSGPVLDLRDFAPSSLPLTP